MIIPIAISPIVRRQDLPDGTPDQTETTITPSTTTVEATATGGLLSSAADGTHLEWWQLLCIGIGGAIAPCILIWVYWRHKRKRKTDKKRKQEARQEESMRVKEELDRQKREDEAMKKGREKQSEGKGKKGRGRGRGSESDSDDWSSSEESYDSVSDGGTIRPRRRRKMGRGRARRRGRSGRGRRDWSDTASETETETDDSDYSYIPRNRRRRGRRRGRYGDGDSDDDIHDIYDRRAERRNRRGGGRGRYDPETPTPPLPPFPAAAVRGKCETFRDSVFSSYASMKKAAVRLKYVEQKVKLKKQLEAEEAVEQVRRDKVVQANKEIKRQKEEEEQAKIIEEIRAEKKMRRVEREMEEANKEVKEANPRMGRSRRPLSKAQSSGDSSHPLIPPARTYTLSSSGGSSASTTRFQSPPARRQPTGQSTYDRGAVKYPPNAKPSGSRQETHTLFDAGAMDATVPLKKPTMRPPIRKQSTFAPTAVLPYATPHPPPPARKGSGLGSEINHLLGARPSQPGGRVLYPKNGQGGTGPLPQRSLDQMKQGFTRPPVPPVPQESQNAFQASWLSRPDPTLSVPQTARADSVYVPVTRPKDRPIIPPGGLAPAPPGKKKSPMHSGGNAPGALKGGSAAVSPAGNGNKWADRLRAKR